MISVTILTKNSAKFLKNVLESVAGFEEVLIFDNGSTDETLEIAGKFPNVRLAEGTFEGFGPTHNKASQLAKYDWILSIDSDEIVTPEMAQEIFSAELDPNAVYSFPRHNYFNGKWIRWCGWYPDRQIRLFNRKKTAFTNAQVHESIISQNCLHIKMGSPLRHFSYTCTSDFLDKMQSYSNLFAKQNQGKKSSSLFKGISHGLFSFFKSYFIKRGFMGGREGFIISIYNANTAFYKYLKLDEANRQK